MRRRRGDGEDAVQVFVLALVRTVRIVRAFDQVRQERSVFKQVGKGHRFRSRTREAKGGSWGFEGRDAGELETWERIEITWGRLRQIARDIGLTAEELIRQR